MKLLHHLPDYFSRQANDLCVRKYSNIYSNILQNKIEGGYHFHHIATCLQHPASFPSHRILHHTMSDYICPRRANLFLLRKQYLDNLDELDKVKKAKYRKLFWVRKEGKKSYPSRCEYIMVLFTLRGPWNISIEMRVAKLNGVLLLE